MKSQNREDKIELYEMYNQILTSKQNKIFKDYYYEDYSLSEIAEIEKTTRSNIHQVLNQAINKMQKNEQQLKFIHKRNIIVKILSKNSIDSNIIKKIKEL